MVPFAGYELPVQYPDGVVTNHMHVRQAAGLFDVGHMGQLRFHGKDREKFVERVTVCDVGALKSNAMALSVITNEKGGIIDDCIVTQKTEYIGMVVNGACKVKDMQHFNEMISQSKMDVQIEYLGDDMALVALQGPSAAKVLSGLLDRVAGVDMNKWAFMSNKELTVAGIRASVSRCGYTGEDGFEISVAPQDAVALFDALIANPEVKPAGLGVRDSLRLEAGLCLYGHDLDDTVSPIEASLLWTISKRRRAAGGFLGFEHVRKQIDQGCARKRVGLFVTGAPAREGSEILDATGAKIGVVTSGTFSPILKKPVAMGYVATASADIGTPLRVVVRGKAHDAVVTKMPFVPTRYHKAL